MSRAACYELLPPPNDGITAVAFAPSSTELLVSSWDQNVHLYDIGRQDGQGSLKKSFAHNGPVLDVCYGPSDDVAFSVGLDMQVNRIDLISGDITVLSKHSAGARRVVYCPGHSMLVSAAWDSTLHFHDLENPSSAPLVVSLPGKPHALAASPTKLVVALTTKAVLVYDLASASAALTSGATSLKCWQERESSLKYLPRAVSCMPNDAGFAISSIEGRVAVEWFENTTEKQYAFKCHRQPAPDEDVVVAYPVNALVFHPEYRTFATGGGDGHVALWDAEAKRRMKQYQKFPENVSALAFSPDGKYLAIGSCPGFQTGQEDYSGQGSSRVFVRELGDSEAKPKGAK
ncbi:related to GLE2 - required for nuclear pore complex structure and function [Cephalotrichum gorgonifer]|uniref:Related to GLE2 - required for nuclear pore complex structure and function n=1 Tax=Cephalotrichum gorgonifer TaxID=2041049 RepID=A0AAE8MQK4_9PEZI|nr:related to GLE2 - required for nuclear pore complex structure and function [Cephalotrichum gorgonifer]